LRAPGAEATRSASVAPTPDWGDSACPLRACTHLVLLCGRSSNRVVRHHCFVSVHAGEFEGSQSTCKPPEVSALPSRSRGSTSRPRGCRPRGHTAAAHPPAEASASATRWRMRTKASPRQGSPRHDCFTFDEMMAKPTARGAHGKFSHVSILPTHLPHRRWAPRHRVPLPRYHELPRRLDQKVDLAENRSPKKTRRRRRKFRPVDPHRSRGRRP